MVLAICLVLVIGLLFVIIVEESWLNLICFR